MARLTAELKEKLTLVDGSCEGEQGRTTCVICGEDWPEKSFLKCGSIEGEGRPCDFEACSACWLTYALESLTTKVLCTSYIFSINKVVRKIIK